MFNSNLKQIREKVTQLQMKESSLTTLVQELQRKESSLTTLVGKLQSHGHEKETDGSSGCSEAESVGHLPCLSRNRSKKELPRSHGHEKETDGTSGCSEAESVGHQPRLSRNRS